MTQLRNLTCKTNPVQRASGGNAIAAAAYRAGENLRDERSGTMMRFAGRSPDISETLILSQEDAPSWHFDRAALWNDIEARETRKDARTGRDVVLGLAVELEPEQRREAVLEFANREFIERGYVVDIAFHKYGSAVRENSQLYDQRSGRKITGQEKIDGWKAQDNLPFLEAHQVQGVETPHVKIERMKGGDVSGYKLYQPHAHVLSSPRAWDAETGAWAAKKDPHFNKPDTAMNWRYDWPKIQNRYLEAAGYDLRVTCSATESDETVPQAPESLPNQQYHMEARDIPTTAALEADFNRIQNEAVRASVENREERSDGTPNVTPAVEAATTGGWWRNMREHFSEKRQDWKAHMRSTWDRLKDRWRKPPTEVNDSPQTTVDADSATAEREQPNYTPPEQTRGGWEYEP